MSSITAVALFCEDIRREIQGSDSLVGVMADNLHLEGFPGVLPRLCIYLRINFPAGKEPPKSITCYIALPDEGRLDLPPIQMELVERAARDAAALGAPFAGIVSRVIMAPLPVQSQGRMNVMLEIDGEKSICGTLNVSAIIS